MEETLTPIQMRVQIAQDVIDQLNSRQMVASHGNIWTGGKYSYILGSHWDLDLRDELRRIEAENPDSKEHCFVCAKGALFLAHVERNDEVTVGQARTVCNVTFDDRDRGAADAIEAILDYFPSKMIQELETAFENQMYSWNPSISFDEFEAISSYRRKWQDEHPQRDGNDWLKHLMQLIVDSNGEKIIL